MNYKILIVDSNYYENISKNLYEGAENYLRDKKIRSNYIKAPGCFEIPYIIKKKSEDYDGFIALGCIIRGETYHFELISNEVTRKIMDLSIKINKPIGFGILTCENLEQAMERSDPSKKNKGAEAAKACQSLLFKTIN